VSDKKKQVRANFRNATFKRDGYCCIVCKKQATETTAEAILDAHHITNRNELPAGGYCKENGATLCKGDDGTSCHEKAEMWLSGEAQPEGYSPDDLYRLIGSSLEKALSASLKL
jgi:hypothetical protein